MGRGKRFLDVTLGDRDVRGSKSQDGIVLSYPGSPWHVTMYVKNGILDMHARNQETGERMDFFRRKLVDIERRFDDERLLKHLLLLMREMLRPLRDADQLRELGARSLLLHGEINPPDGILDISYAKSYVTANRGGIECAWQSPPGSGYLAMDEEDMPLGLVIVGIWKQNIQPYYVDGKTLVTVMAWLAREIIGLNVDMGDVLGAEAVLSTALDAS